ncbi:MAG: TylF/MycF/NovP-related O-methyltransferase [Acidobacteriaceae bacterium]
MAGLFSAEFRKDVKRALYKRFGIVIFRWQVVLDMERLSTLTTRDSIRVCSLYAVAKEIYANSIAGSVAELGVYQGDFAKHIHAAFPDRTLYLFDTFEGFNEKDKGIDVSGGFSSGTEDFSDTSVDVVLGKLDHFDRAVVRKGYFPESIQDADREESFAFVSIDADLYKPIYDGLQFFYPRLSKGGTIFLHDYNNSDYPGAKAAVQKYCKEMGISYFPLVDPCGTAVITKG